MKQILLLLTIVSVSGFTPVFAEDTQQDFDATKIQVNQLQAPDPQLPTGVAQPKGRIGDILSKMFSSGNGKIGARYLSIIGADGTISPVFISGATITGVNATTFGGQGPSYYLNANNITSGTLTGSVLPNNVVLTSGNQTIAGIKTFTGDLLVNGITVGKGSGNISTNTALGSNALLSNTTGPRNTAVGLDALRLNTTGTENTALGAYSLDSNTTGYSNVAIGLRSLQTNTDGIYNTAVGSYSLYSNTTGGVNVAHGYRALYSNTTGYNNVALGAQSLDSNTTGYENVANGYRALDSNTIGNGNTAIGVDSLYFNTTGYENLANGYRALYSNTIGNGNTAIGVNSLYYNTTGGGNIALGAYAGGDITTGMENIAIGNNAQVASATGSYQLSIGNWIYGTNGNIGIGTLTPAYKLDVNGNLNTTGNVGIGTATPDTNVGVKVGISTVNGGKFGGYMTNAVSGTFTAARNNYGGYSNVTNTADNATFSSTVYGQFNESTHNSASISAGGRSSFGAYNRSRNTNVGNLNTSYGSYNISLNDGGGDITSSFGTYGYSRVNHASSVITNSYGGYFASDIGTGSITNSYGVYIGTVAGTNPYGLYQATATADNYFAGRVGIGTNSPVGLFHINTTADVSITSTTHPLTIGPTTGVNLAIDNNEILARNNGVGGELYIQHKAGAGDTILNSVSGNVGIGTNSPAAKLDVAGDIQLTGNISSFGSAFYGDSKNAIQFSDTWLRLNNSGNFGSGTYTPNILRVDGEFQVGSAGARMVVETGGNVGIGTTTPTAKLHVNGNIIASTPTANNHVATKAYVDSILGDYSIGVGQDWVNVTSSRNHSTSYRNTTGKAIMVSITTNDVARDFQVSTDNTNWVTVMTGTIGSKNQWQTIIPNNHYYRINGSLTIFNWAELR